MIEQNITAKGLLLCFALFFVIRMDFELYKITPYFVCYIIKTKVTILRFYSILIYMYKIGKNTKLLPVL